MIGEIAARLSGGYMSGWTYPYASGTEPTRAAILVAMGRSPEAVVPTRHWVCAERAFISIPGKVRAIRGIEELRKDIGIKDASGSNAVDQPAGVRALFLRAETGSIVNFPENNVTKCGNIIAAAPDRAEAVNLAEKAARSLLIRLQAPNAETGAFLTPGITAGAADFPPDAFSVGAEILSALEKLPAGSSFLADTELVLVSFPLFENSGLKDYAGRTIEESLEAVRSLTGQTLPLADAKAEKANEAAGKALGREFWAALIRGGYQGAVYYIDRILNKE
jgi:hypothetical protein